MWPEKNMKSENAHETNEFQHKATFMHVTMILSLVKISNFFSRTNRIKALECFITHVFKVETGWNLRHSLLGIPLLQRMVS